MPALSDNKFFRATIYLLASSFSVLLFLKNAWIAEDAFILLRSVEQYLHGNGFRWNPHERVQAYTSPLWFLLVVASTFFSKTLYLNVMALSLALHVALLIIMARLIRSPWRWAGAVLLLTLSQGHFDFTSSGLEYPLAYLLIGAFILLYLRDTPVRDRYWLALTAGLAVVTRHDLLMLLAPMLLQLLWSTRQVLTARQLAAVLAVFIMPLACWTLFSLLYYGVPLPNTAYGKLAIEGVSQFDRFRRGMIYLKVSLQTDPVTPLLVLLAGALGLSGKTARLAALGAGILLGFIYVCWIGGDYMIGRFYAPLYLAAVLTLTNPQLHWRAALSLPLILPLAGLALPWLLYQRTLSHGELLGNTLLLLHIPLPSEQHFMAFFRWLGIMLGVVALLPRIRKWLLILSACLLALTTQQHDSPWQTHWKNWGKTADNDIWWMLNTVSRERYWIFRWTSLHAWFSREPGKPFPDHPYCHEGIAEKPLALTIFAGMTPYCGGTDKIIVEWMGLADPLLARMPRTPEARWASGGVKRIVPTGYLESIDTGSNRISDPDLAQYYDKLRLLTQSEALFTRERLTTIVAFNLGRYDHWLDAHNARVTATAAPP